MQPPEVIPDLRLNSIAAGHNALSGPRLRTTHRGRATAISTTQRLKRLTAQAVRVHHVFGRTGCKVRYSGAWYHRTMGIPGLGRPLKRAKAHLRRFVYNRRY